MIRKSISCVLKLSDGATKKVLGSSQAQIYVDDIPVHHEYKQGGYFVLIDLPEGKHTVKITSYCFQSEIIEVFVDYSTVQKPENMVRYIILNPSERHPLAASLPAVRGRADGFDRIYILRHRGALKIAEDNADAGKTEIKLFCPDGKPILPCMYRIEDSASEKCEFVTLKGADGDRYMLDKPLKHAHPRSADIVPMICVGCDADGDFFFLLAPEFKRDDGISLTILADKSGTVYTAQVKASEKGVTELGEIKLKKG
ncbi:MAG: hypothetical protein ACI4KA_07100 [Oscillospiraceae bacterium]